mgnify:CR=1 FL=1
MNNMNTIIIGGRKYSEQDVVREKEDYVRLEAVDLCFALYALVQDESPVVRAAVARKKVGHEQLVSDDSWRVRATVAKYADDFQVLDQLLEDENDFVRFVIVKRGYRLNCLINDKDEEIASIARYQLQNKKVA